MARKTHTSSEVKRRYNEKHYDNILLVVKKGKKDIIKAAATSENLSVNGWINKVIDEKLHDISEENT